ncbi:MAG: MBL fold metallo-hydrolase [Ignavibacteriaceae bacterium]
MAYEVDYIPVGDGEKSGDAIAIRFGNLLGTRQEQTIIVIDGGFRESGELLVQHINQYYKTNDIDLVISTHPDADHASGLLIVLEKCKVSTLLMHKPWDHAEDIKNLFKDGRITASGLEERLEKSLQHASDLEALATKKGVTIVEPFQGVTGYNNALHILGPSEEYYKTLLSLFRPMTEQNKLLEILMPIKKAAEEVARWIEDRLDIDLLNDDEDKTSPENNSSVIALFNFEGHKLLFTGDTGKTGLLFAIDYADNKGITLTDLNFFDVPHHGSKRNLSSKVLSKIKATTAFVSAPKNSPKHPAKKISNALKKHGMKVFVNRNNTLRHSHEAPDRINWGPAKEEEFYKLVEE